MDAIKFLITEHNRFRRTFMEISDPTHHYNTKIKMLAELCIELVRHETMEQKIWYPHFKKQLNDKVTHLISEEKKAEATIKELPTIDDQAEWEDKFNDLRADVEHHASEEEDKLFPEVAKILNEEELKKIGKQMQEFKKEFETSK